MLTAGEILTGANEALSILDSAKGEEITRLAEASPEQVDAAMRAAGAAFRPMTPSARAGLLLDIAAAIATIRTGAPRDPGTEMGPLVSAAHRQKVAAMVARSEGEIVTGGRLPDEPGFFYPPTLVAVEAGAGCDMSVFALDAFTAVRHVMVAHA